MSHSRYIKPEIIKYTPKNSDPLPIDTHIYAFDLDHTLIQPKNPKAIFAKGPNDWKFMEFKENEPTLNTLVKVCQDDPLAQIVIFTNQGGVITVPSTSKSCSNFTQKVENIFKYIATQPNGDLLLKKLWLYSSTMKPAALFPKKKKNQNKKNSVRKQSTLSFLKTEKPSNNENGNAVSPSEDLESLFNSMRKPCIGMAEQFIKDICERSGVLTKDNIKWIYYCGDAAGRKTDFSDTDKLFAEKLEIDFKIPEDIFKD